MIDSHEANFRKVAIKAASIQEAATVYTSGIGGIRAELDQRSGNHADAIAKLAKSIAQAFYDNN